MNFLTFGKGCPLNPPRAHNGLGEQVLQSSSLTFLSSYTFFYSSGGQLGTILPFPPGTFGCLETFFIVTTLGKQDVLLVSSRVKDRDTAKHPTMHRIAPIQ